MVYSHLALVYNVTLNAKKPGGSRGMTNSQASAFRERDFPRALRFILWEQWNQAVGNGKVFAKGLQMTQVNGLTKKKKVYLVPWHVMFGAIKYISKNKSQIQPAAWRW